MIKTMYTYLQNGAASYNGTAHNNALFVLQKQLKDRKLWDKFVAVFEQNADVEDRGWRGEYFGKMMRGACLTYRCYPDGELYDILYQTVQALLNTQDEEGRITTYTKEVEFNGWDLWTRKYVLVGCLYFYEICEDEIFKGKIIKALQCHVDYLVDNIGEGKTSIFDTSLFYGALNSSSILEPIIELYRLTNEERYLAFAEYILHLGGSKTGNLLELAEKAELMPYQYPETKAYEMMSYFEGVLAYYEVTGNERYLHIVEKFVDAVRESDITIIGCAGCTHEFFDNSSLRQTDEVEDKTLMQETCVTVTWMRLLERLLRLTGKEIYMDGIERSAYNALYGSINIYGNKQYCSEEKAFLDGVPFDSYSPLVNQPRGIGIGGYKKFKEGGYYGCCACIGAAGTGLFPLIGVMKKGGGVVFNSYHNGVVDYEMDSGSKVQFQIQGDYLGQGEVVIKILGVVAEQLSIDLRIPSWSNYPQVKVNGETYQANQGYCTIERKWKNGDEIQLSFYPELRKVDLNEKVAFIYGNIVLARDEQKEKKDINQAISVTMNGNIPMFQKVEPEQGEVLRFLVNTDEGEILLTDYASCGKKWDEENARISVWFKQK